MTKNDREYIQKLLANDKVAKAIKYLLDNTDISDERINKVIQISGDFNELEHAIGQGTISEGSKTVRRNRIRASLLKLILDEKQDETIDDDKDLTQIPTINLDKLVGRKEELTAIHEKLTNNQTLLIHGIRGVGKSVIAKYYINTHREDYNYAIWINVVDNIKESMLADTYFLKKIGVNMSQIKYGFQKNQQRNNFEPILKQLRAFKDRFRSKKNILILDNVTDVNDLKETLVHFPKIHWKIIVIANQKMGFLEHSSLLVNPLPSKESIELFKKHTDKKIAEQDELLLSLLLKKIENHPLTIELLSKYYTYSIDATLHGLLEMFESKKFDEANFNLKVETAHNDFEQPIEVYSYIYKVFDTNSLSMNEAMILGLFSILPPLEIEGAFLLKGFKFIENSKVIRLLKAFGRVIQFTFGDRPSFWEKSSIANALNSLNQRGWLDLREGKYKCHGIIREVVYQDVNNTLYKFYEACCTNLASHAHYSGQYMLAFLINNNMLRFMDIHSFTKKHDQKRFYLYADIVQNLGNLGLVPLALEYIEEGKKYIDTVSNYKKTSWAVEGFKIYVQTGNSKLYNKAKKHVKASLEEFPLRKKEAALHMKYHSFIARWYFQKQEYAKSIKELEKSKKICEEYKVHKIHYIRILGALGEGYFKLKKYADTVLYSEESLRLSREIFGHNEHPKDEDTIDILQQARKLLKRKEAKRKLKK